MIRRLAIATVAGAAVISALPAQAAPKAQQLYFANQSGPTESGCTPAYTLSKAATPDQECTGRTVGPVQGNGVFENDLYTLAKGISLKVDVSRPLTGTVYIISVPLAAVTAGGTRVPPNLPGYAKATFTVKANGTKVDSFVAEGVIHPVDGLKKDFSLKLPASLKNKTVTKLTVDVAWADSVGNTSLSYTAPTASIINVPTR